MSAKITPLPTPSPEPEPEQKLGQISAESMAEAAQIPAPDPITAPESIPIPEPPLPNLPPPPKQKPTIRSGRRLWSRADHGPPPSVPTLPLPLPLPLASAPPPESTRVKMDRLLNFLLLPPHLEGVLLFGVLACLDAWLYNFTILPLRFVAAVAILARWAVAGAWRTVADTWAKIGHAIVPRRRGGSRGRAGKGSGENTAVSGAVTPVLSSSTNASDLLPTHKADIIRGLLIVGTCAILMRFDASRMYHHIRVQSAIKLYVIFNVLEVTDRLLSAIGQDIIECLLSPHVLDRDRHGRSRVWRPVWMFALAIAYTTSHAIALFYQAITLNVAVNSYSNALLTLLLSNQFVEVKGTVFKRFDREGLFQITCADIIERFQLWLMVTIVAMRNLGELGPFFGPTTTPWLAGSGSGSGSGSHVSAYPSWTPGSGSVSGGIGNLSGTGTITTSTSTTTPPSWRAAITPTSFTLLLPHWAGHVLTPVLVVLGSEMLVDWLKHAYITKFSNTRRDVYERFLDVLAKDYYTNAFSRTVPSSSFVSGPDITRRLGLPVIPLSCLFIRAFAQTYRMIITTHVPQPQTQTLPPLNVGVPSGSDLGPTTTAALSHIDYVFRRALGRSPFGAGIGLVGAASASASASGSGHPSPLMMMMTPQQVSASAAWLVSIITTPYEWYLNLKVWEFVDDIIALTTIGLVALAFWLVLLAVKLILGAVLLRFSKRRYRQLLYRQRAAKQRVPGPVSGLEQQQQQQQQQEQVTTTMTERDREREREVMDRRGRQVEPASRLRHRAKPQPLQPISTTMATTMVTSAGTASTTTTTTTTATPSDFSDGPGSSIGPAIYPPQMCVDTSVSASPGVAVHPTIRRRGGGGGGATSLPSSSTPTGGGGSVLSAELPPLTLPLTLPLPADSIVRRAGPFGTVQLSDAHRECFYENDPSGLTRACGRARRDMLTGSIGLAKPEYDRGVNEVDTETDTAAVLPQQVAQAEVAATAAAAVAEAEREMNRERDGNADTDREAYSRRWIGNEAANDDLELVRKLANVGRYDMVGKRIW